MVRTLKAFQPGRGYSKEDWDSVDSPPLTDEELASMRPAKEVLPPEFFTAMDEYRLAKEITVQHKTRVTLLLDDDVVAKFREGGKGWQGRMGAALRKAAGL